MQEFLLKSKTDRDKAIRVGTTESKIIIILLYFIITGVVSLSTLTCLEQTLNTNFQNLLSFFICESRGIAPGNSTTNCVLDYDNCTNLPRVTIVLLTLFPAVLFIFALDFHLWKSYIQLWKSKLRKYFRSKQTTCSNNTNH